MEFQACCFVCFRLAAFLSQQPLFGKFPLFFCAFWQYSRTPPFSIRYGLPFFFPNDSFPANHMAATQRIEACRLEACSVRMGQKEDGSDFERGYWCQASPKSDFFIKPLLIYWDSLHVASICYRERSQNGKISSAPQINRSKPLDRVRGQSGQIWVGHHRKATGP